MDFVCLRRFRLVAIVALSLLVLFSRLSGVRANDGPESAVGPLMKLFSSGRLPPDRQGTVVEMICGRGNASDLRAIADRIFDPSGFDLELRLRAMQWLTDAAKTRKVKPSGDLSRLAGLVADDATDQDPRLRVAAIRLAASWKDAVMVPSLHTIVVDKQARPELRRAALEGLIAIEDPRSRELLAQLTGTEYALVERMGAVVGLTGFDLETAARAASRVLKDATPQDDTAAVIQAFLDRKGGAEMLAAALEHEALAADVAKRALRYMYSVGRSDKELSDGLSRLAGIDADSPPPTPVEVARIVADVDGKGDPERGEEIFRRNDLNCMKCHAISRAGGQVGPDLSAVGGSSPTDYVVTSILDPNAAVKEQYVTRVVVTTDGRVLTGIIQDRDEVRVRLKDALGDMVTIPTADIEEEFEGKSLMPQGLTKFLTRDELVDLARFIAELGKPGPYAVRQDKWIQRWRVLRSPPDELIRDVPHLDHFRQHIVGSQPADWDSAYGRVSGDLPLTELRSGDSPTVVILQGEIDVAVAGTIAVTIASTETIQTWVDAQPFQGLRELRVELPTGRHAITLRVEISEGPTPTVRVECRTPEGSESQFAVVGGA